jgi:hypothetical protein
VRIAVIVEGKTEKAFFPHLRTYLKQHLENRMPRLDPVPQAGRIPTREKLKRLVENLLTDGRRPADLVIALTDVYTGSQPPELRDAQDAKDKMRQWVGNNPKFRPHAPQHDFEAWLLPYWSTIQRLAGSDRNAPPGKPEGVNHNRPPAHHLDDVFRTGNKRKAYVKARDANRILQDNSLDAAIK